MQTPFPGGPGPATALPPRAPGPVPGARPPSRGAAGAALPPGSDPARGSQAPARPRSAALPRRVRQGRRAPAHEGEAGPKALHPTRYDG
jgi:hypothetical protein